MMNPSFGNLCDRGIEFYEYLGDLFTKYRPNGKLRSGLAKYLFVSNAWVTNILNGDLPDTLNFPLVNTIADYFDCEDNEREELIRAFACSVLRSRGVV